MFNSGSFTRSRTLLSHAVRIVAKDRKLLLFPAIGILSGLFVFLLFFAPALLEPTGFGWSQEGHWARLADRFTAAMPLPGRHGPAPLTAIVIARFAGYYLAAMFTSTFLNVAFYHEIMRALAGERASIRGGLAFALTRIRAIVAWTLFAASVGLALQLLSERLGWVGRFALRLIGVSWSVAAAFAIPVLIRAPSANPLHLLKASASTIKKTWGECVVGFVGIQSGMVLAITCIGIGLACHLSLLTGHASVSLIGVSVVVLSIWIVLVGAASAIYRCALYIYATEGVLPEPYDATLMDAAWSVKKIR